MRRRAARGLGGRRRPGGWGQAGGPGAGGGQSAGEAYNVVDLAPSGKARGGSIWGEKGDEGELGIGGKGCESEISFVLP